MTKTLKKKILILIGTMICLALPIYTLFLIYSAQSDYNFLEHNILKSEKGYAAKEVLRTNAEIPVRLKGEAEFIFFKRHIIANTRETWIKVDCTIKTNKGIWDTYLNTELKKGDSIKLNKVALFTGTNKEGRTNRYLFYTSIPAYFNGGEMRVYISKNGQYDAILQDAKITILEK